MEFTKLTYLQKIVSESVADYLHNKNSKYQVIIFVIF